MKRENQIRKGHNYVQLGNGGNPVRFDSNIQRNDPCHCKSGRKYKKCCEQKDKGIFAIPEGHVVANVNMTRDEVKKMLKTRPGLKFTHDLFADHEYIYAAHDGLMKAVAGEKIKLYDERSIELDFEEFFITHMEKEFASGWRIYKLSEEEK